MDAQADFVLLSRWRVAAPLPAVWRLLSDPQGWPAWWPYVRAVRPLSKGSGNDVGSRRRIEWGSALGYGISLDVTTTRVVEEREIEGRAQGDLDGVGLWRLESDAGGTVVTYRWAVVLRRPWMRRMLPLLRPVFAWNHNAVMRAGARGMARRLAAPLIPCGTA